MKLWQRAVGALKDHNSIWQANLSRRSTRRNPEIEKAVIRSTTHSENSFDRHNVVRICEWIFISPYNLTAVLAAVSNRMARTRNWVVALKGLHLMHNVVNSNLPCVRRIGRLPFDLSCFSDAHSSPAKSWPFNSFVRAYYAFLDKKLTFVCQQGDEKGVLDRLSMIKELTNLQNLQALIDLSMQIRPQSRSAYVPIILDVVDGTILEIYDIYSRICRGIAIVLMNIYSTGKGEAKMALEVVKKAMQQGEELEYYFEFCEELGCFYTSEFPNVDKIPEEAIQELEQIIRGFDECEDKTIIVVEDGNRNSFDYEHRRNDLSGDELKTVITDKWEIFNDEISDPKNPFLSPSLHELRT